MKVLLFLFFFYSSSTFALTILLDPGHGGEDKGAKTSLRMGKHKHKVPIYEKDIALSIAKIIHYKLLAKGHRSFLTRSIDREVSLSERAALADKVNADLYISIHANASTHSQPSGFETYYLDNHNDMAVKKIEAEENKHWEGEELVINQILTDLIIQRTSPSSRRLAKSINSEISRAIKRPFKMIDRGVKPGLFYVLALSKRPSVLLEVGFLSNKKELRKILNPRFQNRYATAVVRGLEKYIRKSR